MSLSERRDIDLTNFKETAPFKAPLSTKRIPHSTEPAMVLTWCPERDT